MKFQVPQFIEMEDKIFGPLSFKEFIYLAGGAGLSYILYRFIPSFYLSLIFIIPVLGLACALAFYKVNNKPFIEVLQSAFIFAVGRKLYIWKKEQRAMSPQERTSMRVPTLGKSKLTNMGFNLDVKEKKSDSQNINEALNIRI